jgi:hypothetical protein
MAQLCIEGVERVGPVQGQDRHAAVLLVQEDAGLVGHGADCSQGRASERPALFAPGVGAIGFRIR